jgi:hypothetical protein
MNTYHDNTPNRKINAFQYDAKTIIPLGFLLIHDIQITPTTLKQKEKSKKEEEIKVTPALLDIRKEILYPQIQGVTILL